MVFKHILYTTIYLALLSDVSVRSDPVPSISHLENEIVELKAQVRDLNTKVEFVLNVLETDGHLKVPLGNNRKLSDNRVAHVKIEEPPFIVERLEEVERILIDAPEDIGPQIYFATEGGGIRVYSDVAHDIRTVVRSTEDIEGMAYDPVHDRIYFCSWTTIYRTNREGNEVEIVFHDINAEYNPMFALAVDWITGNLYGGTTESGKIFVCNTATSLPLTCTTILEGTGGLYGIALSPNEGHMYWTSLGGIIMKAEMDGSNPVKLVGGLVKPSGIAIDHESSRLFWADYHGHRIQSSTLMGEDIRTVLQLSEMDDPWGVALHGNKLYWGSRGPKVLQSSTKDGDNIRMLYNGTHPIQHLTLTTRNLRRTRVNDCQGHVCANKCVFTSTAHRCLP